jgi:hypothetical protein
MLYIQSSQLSDLATGESSHVVDRGALSIREGGIYRKTWQWTTVGNAFRECHVLYTWKTCFVDFGKEFVHYNRYIRLNFPTLTNSPVVVHKRLNFPSLTNSPVVVHKRLNFPSLTNSPVVVHKRLTSGWSIPPHFYLFSYMLLNLFLSWI